MTKKNIELSNCSKEGCLKSIERLKTRPASRQWDLTSGGHLEVLPNGNVLTNVFKNTTVRDALYLFMFDVKENRT